MEKKTPLLDEIGRKHGMKVPGNYFADFTEKMTESLPEREFPELVQPSLWLRVRPWIYMAAMFAGIWLMMKMFTGIFSVETCVSRRQCPHDDRGLRYGRAQADDSPAPYRWYR